MILTPEGKIAQYYYGVEYPPKDLRLGLVQARTSKIGNVVDQVLLYCYHYDPQSGKVQRDDSARPATGGRGNHAVVWDVDVS